MPINNITKSQRQDKLFGYKLSEELNKKNKLYKLRELINWEDLEKATFKYVKISQFGRNRKCHRTMLGISMLQAMYRFSDALAAEEFLENVYWQYFCGYEYMEQDLEMSESSVKRFRDVLGVDGYNEIMKEMIRIGLKIGSIKKKDLTSIIVDTTVQIKNVKHPHDVHLMEKARLELVRLCRRHEIYLNETYAKTFKRDTIKLWKYKINSQAKKRKKIMKHLKVLLGRLIRVCESGIEKGKVILTVRDIEVLSRIKKVHAQSVLSKSEKEKYKEENKILYSFHAPEVECIGKGKLHKPYEFGNKVAVSVTGRRNFVLGAKAFHHNPYDGHTLAQTAESVEQISGVRPEKMFVDLGYRGSNVKEKSKVYNPYTKKKLTKEEKKMIKRRAAVEPVIGHLKNVGRMGRNYLKGVIGDIINPLVSAVGFNMRSLANYLKKLQPT